MVEVAEVFPSDVTLKGSCSRKSFYLGHTTGDRIRPEARAAAIMPSQFSRIATSNCEADY